MLNRPLYLAVFAIALTACSQGGISGLRHKLQPATEDDKDDDEAKLQLITDIDHADVGRHRGILVRPTKRLAGAIESLIWNDKEFLAQPFNKGASLQTAWQKDGLGECYNPTEAGSRAETIDAASSSVLEAFEADDGFFATLSHAAFWMRPGDSGGDCPEPKTARNTTALSTHRLSKRVTVGVKVGGQSFGNVIRYLGSIEVPEAVNSFLISAPTGYLAGEFDHYHTIDFATGQTTALPPGKPNVQSPQGKPVILATADEAFAMGVWTNNQQLAGFENLTYTVGPQPFNAPTGAVLAQNDWQVNLYFGPGGAKTYGFDTYIHVGTLAMVRDSMVALHAAMSTGAPVADAPAPDAAPAPAATPQGPAPLVVPSGLFRVGSTAFNSNGSHICQFASYEDFKATTGVADPNTLTAVERTPDMPNDGACKMTLGNMLFRIGGAAYSSNGTRICQFPDLDTFTRLTGRNDPGNLPEYHRVPDMPSDGACQ